MLLFLDATIPVLTLFEDTTRAGIVQISFVAKIRPKFAYKIASKKWDSEKITKSSENYENCKIVNRFEKWSQDRTFPKKHEIVKKL